MKKLLLAGSLLLGLGVSAAVPELTTDPQNPVLYLIKNTRVSKYLKFQGQSQNIAEVTLGNNYEAGQLWYFMSGGTAAEGYTAVRIFPYIDGGNVSNANEANAQTTYSQAVWYIDNEMHTKNSQTGHVISPSASYSANNSWNDYGGDHVCYYSGDDGGSKWLFERADAEKAAAAKAAYSPTKPVTLSTDDNTVYYAIKDVRSGKYAKPHSGAKADLVTSYHSADNEALYDLDCVWYFTAPTNATANPTFQAVRMYNYNQDNNFSAVGSSEFSAAEKVWYFDIFTHTASQTVNGTDITTTGHVISPSASGTDGSSWNNFQGGGAQISTWSGNDVGSKWVFELLDPDVVQNTVHALAGDYSELINHYKVLGNDLVATPLASNTAKNAWNAVASSEATDENAYNDIVEAYGNLLDAVDGTVATFSPYVTAHYSSNAYTSYLSGNGTYAGRYARNTDSHKTLWTLKKSGEGFKLFNEYYQQYLRHPQRSGATNNYGQATLSNEANASVYLFDIYSDAADQDYAYGIHTIDANVVEHSTTTADRNYCYLHNNAQDYCQAWERGVNSSWAISVVDDDVMLAKDYIAGVIDLRNIPYGTGASKVQSATESENTAYTTAIDAATNQRDHGTDAETIRAAATPLLEAIAAGHWVTNTPAEGRYYRLRGAHNNRYLCTTTTIASSHEHATFTTTNNGLETVFLWDGHNFVAFKTGKVLANAVGADNKTYALKSETSRVADVSIEKCPGTLGAYWFHTSTHETNKDNNIFIYNANTNLDRGGIDYPGTPSGDGYEWVMEEVTYLPVPIGSNVGDLTTIYSAEPLGLGYSADRVKAYILDFDGKRVTKLATTVIPANTPVLLSYLCEIENDCVYLPVRRNVTSAEYEGNMSGSYFTAAANGAYALNAAGDFAKLTDATAETDGFKVYLGADNATADSYEIGMPTHADAATHEYLGSSYKWILSHTHGAFAKIEHTLPITFTRTGNVSASAPMRRITAEGNVYTATNNDIIINADGNAEIDLTTLPAGNYDVYIPAEFFTVGGNHYTPEMNLTMVKDTDTGISEIITNDGVEGEIYDLQGRKLAAPVKGINIIGGRKVLVK